VKAASGRVLVLNAGSATLKGTVLDMPEPSPRLDHMIGWTSPTPVDIDRALDDLSGVIVSAGIDQASLEAVGHRVVHGGERFTAPTLLDAEALSALDSVAELAPLHDPVAIATIRAARERLPSIPHVAVFDTAFHATLPDAARRYPLPDTWAEGHGVRRFGFHGLSVEWSVARAASLLGSAVVDLRLVVAHLGGGASVTAVDSGRSISTSMGMTPLEGLMMGTRAGSIDPGIIFRLARDGLALDEIERTLENGSGLFAVGGTADMRRLLANAEAGDRRATLAIEMFVSRAAAGIAAAATGLPKLDALVFTGGIGEHATTVRSGICARLGLMGIPTVVEDDVAGESILGRGPRGTAVLTIHAREDLVVAAAVQTLIGV
jgi:acetate kinase